MRRDQRSGIIVLWPSPEHLRSWRCHQKRQPYRKARGKSNNFSPNRPESILQLHCGCGTTC
ncbi:MAG: hypothetical protein KatS3mg112_1056 [Thermogutta sp.]|nr:MAG: hypothetical protein KatS3mg112_1056 [Thermogutta sp.]